MACTDYHETILIGENDDKKYIKVTGYILTVRLGTRIIQIIEIKNNNLRVHNHGREFISFDILNKLLNSSRLKSIAISSNNFHFS